MKPTCIPMSPTDLPQQRLYVVPDLSDLCDNAVVEICEASVGGIPKKPPRGAFNIGQVEWAWSPLNNRIDNYQISLDGSQRYWLFWTLHFDDDFLTWKWIVNDDVLKVRRQGISRINAARLLLRQYWLEQERLGYLDHFHWVNDEGLLSIGELKTIAKLVWS